MRHGGPGMRMARFRFRQPAVHVVPVMVVVVVVVPPPAHLRRRDRTLDAGHRLQHPLERVAVQTHAVLRVHVLGALRLAPPVVDVVVQEVVVMRGPQLRVPDHVQLGVVGRLRVGQHVVHVLPQLRPRGCRGRLGARLQSASGLRALGFRRFRGLRLRLCLSLHHLITEEEALFASKALFS